MSCNEWKVTMANCDRVYNRLNDKYIVLRRIANDIRRGTTDLHQFEEVINSCFPVTDEERILAIAINYMISRMKKDMFEYFSGNKIACLFLWGNETSMLQCLKLNSIVALKYNFSARKYKAEFKLNHNTLRTSNITNVSNDQPKIPTRLPVPATCIESSVNTSSALFASTNIHGRYNRPNNNRSNYKKSNIPRFQTEEYNNMIQLLNSGMYVDDDKTNSNTNIESLEKIQWADEDDFTDITDEYVLDEEPDENTANQENKS